MILFSDTFPIELIHFSPFTPLDGDTKLNCQKNLDLRIVYKWLTGSSLPVTKTSLFTASPFLLDFYRTFPNLYIDEKTIILLQKPETGSWKIFFRASHCNLFWSWSRFFITPTQSKLAAIHKNSSLNTQIDLRKFISSRNSFLHFLLNFMLIWSLSMIYFMKVLNFSRIKN